MSCNYFEYRLQEINELLCSARGNPNFSEAVKKLEKEREVILDELKLDGV